MTSLCFIQAPTFVESTVHRAVRAEEHVSLLPSGDEDFYVDSHSPLYVEWKTHFNMQATLQSTREHSGFILCKKNRTSIVASFSLEYVRVPTLPTTDKKQLT